MSQAVPAEETVVIDGHTHHLRRHENNDSVAVLHADMWLELQRWTTADHHRVLSRCLTVDQHGHLQLDAPALVEAVLITNSIAPSLANTLSPVVLWWVAHCTHNQVATELGAFRYDGETWNMRPWSVGQRLQALAQSHTDSGIDIVAFGRAMLVTCVSPQHHEQLDKLSSVDSGRLLETVLHMNASVDQQTQALQFFPEIRERVHQAANRWGLPPWELLRRPAAEFDFWTTATPVQTPPPYQQRHMQPTGHSAWTADPNATVITFGGGE